MPMSRMEAAASGLTVYEGVHACRVCGSQWRYTAHGQCVPCQRERASKRQEAIAKKLKAARKGRKRRQKPAPATIDEGGVPPQPRRRSGRRSAPSAPPQNPAEGVAP
jgi:hypothetical protein